ncbi:Iron transporter FTH1 [Wickerhamiella sorbophila]|uniref:Iron transporter FTH1 n=1 Tax=Wickerhamiella sorbophila TaxID=45607 RepID=A0A2T0FH79_9ASCO|nr:Iron transporter FTH1 [Wickerhamiella sorbophila]PRT54317.1 Iron transporter FTH1 [Wickerhamiella sorbophila]
MTFADYFSLQVFFLVFRETLETAVIVTVLLSFLKTGFGDISKLDDNARRTYRTMRRQVWAGAAFGILVCILLGAVFMFVFYTVGENLWDRTEKLWEAFFCIFASVLITIMGLKFLRINRLKAKWRRKLAQVILERDADVLPQKYTGVKGKFKHFGRKYSMAILPFVTTLREGLEAVMFLGGLGASEPSSAFPLAVITAIATGSLVGLFMYKSGSHLSIQYFLIFSTCFLYLISAGLLSRGVWFYEMHQFISKVGSDVSESGSGPGSYDITKSVWHVNCCNPETDGFWMIFNGLLGWQNSATYGSVASYNLYWIFIICLIIYMQHKEKTHAKLAEDLDLDRDLLQRASIAATGRGDSIDSNTPLMS